MVTSLLNTNQLMPNLMPFDGYNPRSVVIMDSCSIYHTEEVSRLIQQPVAPCSLASSIST